MSNTQQHDRAEALIGKILTNAGEEAAQLLAEAKMQAEAITREARGKARLKVHEVVEDLRNREQREMAHEEARFETERRQWRQADEMEALAEGLTHLEAALTRLWADKKNRQQWCQNILEVAQQRLPTKDWRLEHPADLPQAEITVLSDAVLKHSRKLPELIASNSLHAGLRFHVDTACVDGSINAITADRQKTSAMFLGILLAMKKESSS